jgi:hypothetical protein
VSYLYVIRRRIQRMYRGAPLDHYKYYD